MTRAMFPRNAVGFDDFHPHELYVFFKYGPACVGGEGHVCFLKDTLDMQNSLGKDGGRDKHRRKNAEEAQVASPCLLHPFQYKTSRKLPPTGVLPSLHRPTHHL